MANFVQRIEIKRISQNGDWHELVMRFVSFDAIWRYRRSMETEENATLSLLGYFVSDFSFGLRNVNLDQMRSDVLQGFRQLRENDLSGNSQETMEISLIPLKPHFSCKKKKTQPSGENQILQSEIKQKLATVAKDGKVMKFFEDNKCSVCLSSYKEILDNNLHIVVSTCGHPLCCECTYNILVSEKKECPRCRGNLTAKSFSLLEFNADLEVETKDQRVFL